MINLKIAIKMQMLKKQQTKNGLLPYRGRGTISITEKLI